MADNIKNQMRPIARNLKAPPPPRHYVQEPQKHQNRHELKNAAFKTNVLAIQSVKKVRISHYENGPFMFCVQSESSDSDFQRLVGKLQKSELTPLRQFLKSRQVSTGTACLALFEKKVYRVAIARIPQHANDDFFVNFVDYGFNRSIKLDNLFYIPEDFLTQFTYAMTFSLAGCKANELKVSDKEISFYFRLLTENKLLTMKCVPSDGPPICQYCELYTDNNVSVLDRLKQWDPYENLQFRPQTALELKAVHEVKVSYVESAQEFYIHIQKPEILQDYEVTSDELFKVMSHAPIHRNPKSGSCCAVLLGGDYYRALVVGANKNSHTVQVKIVDFGIVEEIPEKHVHLMTEKFVEKPPQAYRASLKGFEGLEVSENISTQFDIFCGDGRGERKVFKMTVLDVNNSYHVELEDTSVFPPVNVNKMLLKNSRPLIETIQLENAKKRQKDSRNFGENFDAQQTAKNSERDRNNSQRGRGNYVNKGAQRNATSPARTNNQLDNRQQSPRTHFGKSNRDENSSVVGTYFKSQKEASVWGSKESTPSDHHSTKSSDWEQPKNIAREQGSTASWNDNSDSTQNSQKSRNSKSPQKKSNGSSEAFEKKTVSSGVKSGWVSTLLTVNRAFVHYDKHVEGLERILDAMFAFYENKNSRECPRNIVDATQIVTVYSAGPLLKDFQVGAECAVRSSDGNWYRSKIDTINGDKVKVFHREYGNSETVQKSKIRELDERFAKLNDLAVKTFFAIKPSPESDEKSLFSEMMKLFESGAKEFSFKVVQKMNDGWILEPIDPNNNKYVLDELVKMKKAQRISDKELQQILEVKVSEKPKEPKKERKSPEKPKKIEKTIESKLSEVQKPPEVQKITEVPKPEIQPTKPQEMSVPKEKETPQLDPNRVLVKMAALTSPTDFYVSRVDETSSVSQLHNDIQIIASGAAPLTDFEEGTLCLAKQSFDLCWYRAKIIDSDDAEQNVMITVRCLDDGKTFSVEDRMFLKMMPAALERKKFFGISCSLPVSIERKCEEDATDLMKNMMDRQLQVIFLNGPEFECKCFVELFNDNENVSDLLVSNNFARRLDMIQAGNCYTSHINSLSSFYLQFEREQLTLDLISQYFEEAGGKFEKVEAKPGKIVAALFPEDDSWYRSRIESAEGNGEYMVTFIDYGNTCLVKNIGEIAESTIRDLPSMSKHCRLALPKEIKCFSEKAEQKFVDICENGATILEIKNSPVKPGEAAEVEIFLKGKNMVEELIPLCNPAEGLLNHIIDSNDSGLCLSQNEKLFID